MTVEIELFGNISPDVQRLFSLTLERSMTVREVINMLGITPQEVGLIVIDGVQRELEDPVPLDCRLCFFPHLSGG
jgi:hypothetical protein